MGKKVVLILAILVVIGLLGFGAYKLFTSADFSSPLGGKKITENLNEGKNEVVENPLNGVIVSEADKSKVLERRPLVVMVGNNPDARPQWNVSKADMVYEVVAEGGITRFMSIFLQNDPEKIGPVRSIRAYFLNWIVELGDAMVFHDGWSKSTNIEASAVDLIDMIPVRSLFRGGLYGERDSSRLAPNNEYISTAVARAKGEELGWHGIREYQKWKFKEKSNNKYASSPDAKTLDIVFWSPGDYDSSFMYDPQTNLYMKSTGGEKHIDAISGVQLSATNVIVQFAKESEVGDEKGHLLYDNIGTGKALVFLDGKVVDSVWAKKDRASRTMFYDTNGQEIEFNRGVIWVSVVPDRNIDQVTYK